VSVAIKAAVVSALLLVAPGGIACAAEGPVPIPLIFDTDICGDCDDVLALAMIHALESRGACRLLAVTVSAENELAGPLVDAVNTFLWPWRDSDRRRGPGRCRHTEPIPVDGRGA